MSASKETAKRRKGPRKPASGPPERTSQDDESPLPDNRPSLLGRVTSRLRPKPTPTPSAAEVPEPADPVDRLHQAGEYDQLIEVVERLIRRGRPQSSRAAWQYARACLETGQPQRLVDTAASLSERNWRHHEFRSRYFQALVSLDRTADAVSFVKESVLLGAISLDFVFRVVAEYRLLHRPELTAELVELAFRRWHKRLSRQNAIFFQSILQSIGSPVVPYAFPRRGDRFSADAYFLLANASLLARDHSAALRHYNRALDGFGLSSASLRDPASPFSAANLTSHDRVEPRGGPLVTIAMSTFNAVETVVAALGSLSRQSYRDLEILVLDDCSADDTVAAVERYAQEAAPRVRLVRMERNGGTYRARNRALAEARGTYFTCNDADDWSHPQKIATLVEALEKGGAVAVQSQLIRLNPEIGIKPKRNGYVHDDMSSTLFRREEVVGRIGYYEPVRFGADSEYVARLAIAFGESALKVVPKPMLVAHWAETTLSAGRGTGISDGGIFYPQRSAYRHGYRRRLARGEGLKRGPDGEVVADQATPAAGLGEGRGGPAATRKGWRLEGSTLIYSDPTVDLFWRMPEGFRMPSNALLTLAERLLFRPFGRDVAVGEEAARPIPADGRVAVAFSGGIDSTAALRLLPDPLPIYMQVANPGGKHRLDNALLAVGKWAARRSSRTRTSCRSPSASDAGSSASAHSR